VCQNARHRKQRFVAAGGNPTHRFVRIAATKAQDRRALVSHTFRPILRRTAFRPSGIALHHAAKALETFKPLCRGRIHAQNRKISQCAR